MQEWSRAVLRDWWNEDARPYIESTQEEGEYEIRLLEAEIECALDERRAIELILRIPE